MFCFSLNNARASISNSQGDWVESRKNCKYEPSNKPKQCIWITWFWEFCEIMFTPFLLSSPPPSCQGRPSPQNTTFMIIFARNKLSNTGVIFSSWFFSIYSRSLPFHTTLQFTNFVHRRPFCQVFPVTRRDNFCFYHIDSIRHLGFPDIAGAGKLLKTLSKRSLKRLDSFFLGEEETDQTSVGGACLGACSPGKFWKLGCRRLYFVRDEV